MASGPAPAPHARSARRFGGGGAAYRPCTEAHAPLPIPPPPPLRSSLSLSSSSSPSGGARAPLPARRSETPASPSLSTIAPNRGCRAVAADAAAYGNCPVAGPSRCHGRHDLRYCRSSRKYTNTDQELHTWWAVRAVWVWAVPTGLAYSGARRVAINCDPTAIAVFQNSNGLHPRVAPATTT